MSAVGALTERLLRRLDGNGGLRMTCQQCRRPDLIGDIMLIQDLIDDIGIGQSDLGVLGLYLRAAIPECADEDGGIIRRRHHSRVQIAYCPSFAQASRIATIELCFEQLKDRP